MDEKMTEGSLRQKMARFLFNYRITHQSTTGVSPFELLMNRKLRSVLDLLNPNLTEKVDHLNQLKKFHIIKISMSKFGDTVYACNYGQ